MGLFNWLFGSKRPNLDSAREEELRQSLVARTPAPKRRGRTPEQRLADQQAYAAELRATMLRSAELTKMQALRIRSPGYIWRTTGDEGVCKTCARNNGKRFKWTEPPPCGEPGTVNCETGWCRCDAEPIIPRL